VLRTVAVSALPREGGVYVLELDLAEVTPRSTRRP
jgi:hypothetical protein